ncbi:MAG: type 1 glutamine amidotransferase [Bdellovibrionales bacterium]|nr:type 1 glutamine amidotransferase [Bdellovibrionales bacterium]
MRIHSFEHAAFEGLGNIADWVCSRGYQQSATRFYEESACLPALSDFDMLLVMGGPMAVYEADKFSWMRSELDFIRTAIEANKLVVGICLGAQLISAALGAAVKSQNFREIGWFPVTLSRAGVASEAFRNFPAEFAALHWHGDTFDLPIGAKLLASSAACRHQAYQVGDRVFCFQFHLDFTEESVRSLMSHCPSDMTSSEFVQAPGEILRGDEDFDGLRRSMYLLLDNIVECRQKSA